MASSCCSVIRARKKKGRRSTTGDADHAEAEVVAAAGWPDPEAVGSSAVFRRAVPTAAPNHAIRALLGPDWVGDRASGVCLVVPVGAPLPDVSVHVVQPEGVRRITANPAR